MSPRPLHPGNTFASTEHAAADPTATSPQAPATRHRDALELQSPLHEVDEITLSPWEQIYFWALVILSAAGGLGLMGFCAGYVCTRSGAC